MPKKAVVVLFLPLMLMVTGCSFLPLPLAYMNYARTGYDVTRIAEKKPTTTDRALSAVTDMNCQLFNVLDGDDICKEKTQKWEP